MKLEVGIYKVQRKDYSEPYGKKHPRPNSNSMHLLTVKKQGNELLCYLDHSMQAEPPERFEDYEIVSRCVKEPIISKCKITLSFSDGAGDQFEWHMQDMWVLKNVLDENRWLQKPFGYVSRKKK